MTKLNQKWRIYATVVDMGFNESGEVLLCKRHIEELVEGELKNLWRGSLKVVSVKAKRIK